jgi:signal peptidase I
MSSRGTSARVRLSAVGVTTVMVSLAFACFAVANGPGTIPVTTVTTPVKAVPYTMDSAEMEPTIHCGSPTIGCLAARPDSIIVDEPVQTIKRFDVLLFNGPRRAAAACGVASFVERVIGLPGDIWSERDGYVYIDGKRLSEPYIKPLYRDHFSFMPRTIPGGQYVLMGDNRSGSCDSRRFGTVPFADLVGQVVRIERPVARPA